MTIPYFGISGTTDSASSPQPQPLTSGFLSWSLWDWSRTTLESTQSELTRTPPHSTDSTSWACWRLLGHLFSWYYRTFPSSSICTSGAQWLCGTLWPGTWCLLIGQSYQVLSLAHFYYLILWQNIFWQEDLTASPVLIKVVKYSWRLDRRRLDQRIRLDQRTKELRRPFICSK